MENVQSFKFERVLGIYTKLMNGYLVSKAEEARRYGVHERSIQRDIDAIRAFLESEIESTGYINSVIYDRIGKGYRLENMHKLKLTNSEVLALCKILLDSRAFMKDEMENMLNKLISCCVPEIDQKLVRDMISNEAFHYVELQHKTPFMNTMWEISQAIYHNRYMEIEYSRMKDRVTVNLKLKPAAIMFSEYYFYLTAFIEDEEIRKKLENANDISPTIYRIDRIKKLNVLDEQFYTPYRDRFEEGEFRKRVQFMYGGKLQKVKFKYSGMNIEAVIDRLPTAEILSEEDGVYTVTAEVFGDGINMWLRSQGDNVEVVDVRMIT